MDRFVGDLRYAVRTLRRSPGFFAVAVLTLALGIGATTSIFSVVYGVLLRPLPYPESDRIVRLREVNKDGNPTDLADPNFADIKAQSRSFAALAQVSDWGVVSVSGASEPARVTLAAASRDFFRVLGVQPALGRLFTPEETREGAAPAVVVSHRFWRRYLGGGPALGRTLTFQSRAYSVVGVMPPELDYPAGTDLWVPRELEAPLPSRTAHNWRGLGRLGPGVSLGQARRDVSAIAKRLKAQYGEETWMVDASLVPLREQMVGRVRETLLMLLGASAFLLLIACANVVNLLMARAAARQGELAVRLALGAGRGRLAWQFVAEALVLATAGALLGVLLATGGVRALLALEPGDLPRVGEVGVSAGVLVFALVLSATVAVAMGLLTAWRGTRGDVREALAQSQRTQAGAGASYRVRGALVVAQMALTLVLLVGAGLLARSFVRLMSVDPGFRTERALVLDVSLPWPEDSLAARRQTRFYDDLIGRLRALPGVSQVGVVSALPLTGESSGDGTFLIMNSPTEPLKMEDVPRLMRDPARTGQAEFRVASGGYFRAMNIPLIRGRLLDDERDAPDAPHVAVISQSLADQKWKGRDPLGGTIQFGNMDGDLRPFTIVGVVGDVRETGLDAPPQPTFYASYRQRPRKASALDLVMQGEAIQRGREPAALITAARRAVTELRPELPPRFRTIEAVVSGSVADRRFLLLLTGVFGAAALVLATLGIYSVISFLVAQRRQEIGVRIALGARREDVLGLVVRQGATLALVGIVVGTGAALVLTRLLARFLYGVGVTDPVSFGAVIVALTVVALAASYVPARRAARVDPMTILRGG